MSAAGGDVDDMIAKALRMEVRFTYHRFRRVRVNLNALFVVAVGAHRILPAKVVFRWVSRKPPGSRY